MRKWAVVIVLFAVLPQQVEAFIIDPTETPWISSATGGHTSNGTAGTLTWSIVPDGTLISDGVSNLGGSDLNAFLATNITGSASGFSVISDALGRWDELSGLSLVYEPNDDGGTHNDKPGVLGVRGDIRIGGASIDGAGDVLAFNFFPSSGGDMVLDTDEGSLFGNSSNNYRYLRNTIMHEFGHGFSLEHVNSTTDNLLLEPSIDTSFDGPQLDEVRAIQFFFGDAYEEANSGAGNGTANNASNLGSLSVGGSILIGEDADVPSQAIASSATDFVSISDADDQDYYTFTVSEYSSLSTELTPLGGTFTQSGDGGSPSSFDASARSDLSFTIFDSNGLTVLGSADNTVEGGTESLESTILEPGRYFARILGEADTIQLYMLELGLASLPGDFNSDGIVDAADYTVWRDSNGTSVTAGTQADGNGDGVINAADYQVWVGNYGTDYALQFGGNSFSTATAVPEPSSFIMLISATIGCLVKSRKRF